MFSIHCLKLAAKIRNPIPALVKPPIMKEIPNSDFAKLQAETKNPTNAKIAPKNPSFQGSYHSTIYG
jgi:hypothetical protein